MTGTATAGTPHPGPVVPLPQWWATAAVGNGQSWFTSPTAGTSSDAAGRAEDGDTHEVVGSSRQRQGSAARGQKL